MKQIINKCYILSFTIALLLLSTSSLGQAVFVDVDGIVNKDNSSVTNSPVDKSSSQYKIPLSLTLYNSSKAILSNSFYKVNFKPSAGTISDFKNDNGNISASLNVDKTVYDKVTLNTTVKYEQDVCDGIEEAKKEYLSQAELDVLNLIDFSFLNSKIALTSPVFLQKEFVAYPTQQDYIDNFLIGNEFTEPIYSQAIAKFMVDNVSHTTIETWLDKYLESFAGIDFTPFPNLAANILKAHDKMTCFRKNSMHDLFPIDFILPSKTAIAQDPTTSKPTDSVFTPRTGGESVLLSIPASLIITLVFLNFYRKIN